MILDPISSSVLKECWGGALVLKIWRGAHTFLTVNDDHVGMGNHSSCLATQSHHVFPVCHLCCLSWDTAQQLWQVLCRIMNHNI